MPDATTDAIDRIFDLVDSGVEKLDRVLNRAKHTEDTHRARRGRVIDVDTAPPVKVHAKGTKTDAPTGAPATSTAMAPTAKSPFRIIETVDAASGHAIFVVTDDHHHRAECSTRQMAEQILRALEGKK